MKLNKADVKAALVALITAAFAASSPRPQVDAITNRDVDADSNITKGPPAALLFYETTDYLPSRDTTRTNYQPEQRWALLLGARNLQSPSAEQDSALAMLDLATDALAGVKLSLGAAGAGGQSEPIQLISDQLIQMSDNGTWYQLEFAVRGLAQYSAKP